jgi:hypothetical protein
MTDEGFDERLCEQLCQKFEFVMEDNTRQNTPEVVYASLEALLGYVGSRNFDFVKSALQELIVMHSGGSIEQH